MPGLRNSGVDTSDWYLPLFAGAELPAVDPSGLTTYDPGQLFGQQLEPRVLLQSFDFTAGSLPAGSTFTRAAHGGFSTTYQTTAAGKYQAGLAVDTPVFIRNMVTGSPLGLRLTRQNTTRSSRSGTLENASHWMAANATCVLGADSTKPFSDLGPWLLTGSAGTGVSRQLRRAISFDSDAQYNTIRTWLKAGTCDEVFVGFFTTADGSYGGVVVNPINGTHFDLTSGTGSVLTSTVTPMADGWYEVVVVANAGDFTVPGNELTTIALMSGGAFVHSTEGESVLIGSIAIHTSDQGGQVVLNGSLTTSNSAEAWTSAAISQSTAGGITSYLEFDVFAPIASGADFLMRLDDGTGNNQIALLGAAANQLTARGLTGGASQFTVSFPAPQPGLNRLVIRYGTNDVTVHLNGSLLLTDNTVSTFSTITRAILGTENNALAPSMYVPRLQLYGPVSTAEALSMSLMGP